ncbi:MAG: hypothetical protein ACT6FF_05350, partial [Methanosarcinaceae archaeon]
MPATIAPLRAYRRAFTKLHGAPFAPIQYENVRGFALLFASGEGDCKSGGEEGEGGDGIGGFIEALDCDISCCAVPATIAPLRAYRRAFTKLHGAPFAPIQCENARGFALLFASGEGGGEGKSGG